MTQDLLDKFRAAIRAGRSQTEIIAEMKQDGLTIIDAIKASRELFSVSLGEAKQMVSHHPDWSMIAAASVPFHESLIQSFDDIATKRTDEHE